MERGGEWSGGRWTEGGLKRRGAGEVVCTYVCTYVSEVMCLGKGVRVVYTYMCRIMLHEAHKSVILYSEKFLREKIFTGKI